jgi:hypothetical protein
VHHVVEFGLDLVVQVLRRVRKQIALLVNSGAVEKRALP